MANKKEISLTVIGKLSDEQIAEITKKRKFHFLSSDKKMIKDRNIVINSCQKTEADRYKLHKSVVSEWSKLHTRFATDVSMIVDAVNELHKKVLARIQEMPYDKMERIPFIEDLQKSIAALTDQIEDAMFQVQDNEIVALREEAERFRKERNEQAMKRAEENRLLIEEEAAKAAKKAEAEAAEELIKEVERKRAEKERIDKENAERAAAKLEDVKQKQEALNSVIDDNTLVLNAARVNKNLLSFPTELSKMISKSRMTSLSLAKTKDGRLVLICDKSVSSKYNVSINYRDNKVCGSVTSNTICSYIRTAYSISDTDEYRFNIHYVAYADNIKIRIDSLIKNN